MGEIHPPWKHQTLARERAKDSDYFALFWEMGTGKSRGIIDILRDRINANKGLLRTIVFGPPITLKNFKEEIHKYSKIGDEDVVILQGSGAKRVKTFLENSYYSPKLDLPPFPVPRIFITNYEALLMKDLFQAFSGWKPEALVFDESHYLKNHKAKRSKLADQLANPKKGDKPLTYLLSGTPVLNSPEDLFQQFLVMDGGVTFGDNFWIFQAKYFVDRNHRWKGTPHYFPDYQIRPGAMAEMSRLIFHHGMRVTKEDCLDLPEEVAVQIKCAMGPEQTRHYCELRDEFITYVKEKAREVVTPLAIVKALRLMQIASGFLPVPCNEDAGELTPALLAYPETEKDRALEELLQELTPNSKVLVWAVWKENYARIRGILEKLGLKYVEVHGGVGSSEKRQDAVREFQSDPTIRVFLGNPGSGGIGVNLVEAPYSIFYSRTFSLGHWLQARARNHRGGQTQKVTHYDLVCEGTIDEEAVHKLAEKASMSKELLGDGASLTLQEIFVASTASKP